MIIKGKMTSNPSTCVPVIVRLNSELAVISRRRPTSSGIVAPSAGAKNWAMALARKVTL